MSESYKGLSTQDYIAQLSIDCVIFGYQNGLLKVLVPKLNFQGDFWGLPSGFIYQHEDVDQAAQRILEDRTQIKDIYLEQFHVFGNAHRNNAEFMSSLLAQNPQLQGSQEEYDWFVRRFVSIGYYALVDIKKVKPQTTYIDEKIEWVDINQLPNLILDGKAIISKALLALRANFDDHLVGYNLLPETFTMKELQNLYETIFDKPYRRNNFQKMMLDLNILKRLEKQFTGAANKAPYLYKFKEM
ncbi:NUDIX hydrolase [Aquirufa aurantiipilula]|uniref:NUDIX domain-containing protein n=1 Tax=Aquirufa aurantiipilula TaxID=2696561 RepID=A0ABT6BM44_9BACT|nr:NUDIX domain-containing protein [Aquirufa aurantiipilula]MDF5691554.1 NUDIX domain-containing protein [Aquirufa aurantiipilula]